MENTTPDSLFGHVQVGYLLIESERLSDWKRFAHQGLGLHLAEESDDLLAFRIDQHQRRLVIRRGPAEDIVALGLHLHDQPAVDQVLSRLRAREIDYRKGDERAAAQRGVKTYWTFDGPKKMAIDLFCEALTTREPLWMHTSGFITGESGMGHIAMTTRRAGKMLRFWQEIFDARVSDTIEENIAGLMLDITFLRFNERHHSIAIAATRDVSMDPIRTNAQHVNLLVATLDDLGNAHRRLVDLGFGIAHEIGQHPNDKEISFYAITPSGFEFELGWNALTVDEAHWQRADYYGISLWGHKPRQATLMNSLATNAGNLRQGLKSLLRPEYSPI